MPKNKPTDRSYQNPKREAVEAACVRAGLRLCGGGTRNSLYEIPGEANYELRVGPKVFRLVRTRTGFNVGPEQYHGQVDLALLEADLKRCVALVGWTWRTETGSKFGVPAQPFETTAGRRCS